ncbi:DNA-3-methyladenine glycosylase [Leptospira interrogans]|uniref:DNA-3-methyladenine glycosylase II n=8 Tax=Leptospira interrogans TaxID=173 RepID=A0A1X8WNJ1_LEPIR|nr:MULTISPECIES: DNA-3-methyladenine glycosylase [Leptospira]APH42174.1 Base excision DNA repair protein, HhH-GPD family [Leptospira interrogans serovar Copenhageni/Icterohaemorrhagiae]EMF44136.1 base excision DNA repair protein, HhH-GPD family [Leptospira interrogans serovar Lora str. TE 1992]EMF71010.1 base excision DNA repair protein, HhH-GPD family [Leptospira interrogans serovar Canicola str. LT1962]EMM97314.1 base excision DNA repair protein, HhH-GPD family [Leptospira interrogans serovar
MKDKILKFEKKEFYSICDQLSRKDRGLHSILLKHGYPPFWSRKPNFETLVHIILEQQVSLASARAALVKLKNKIGSVTARKILLLSDIELRECYFSRQKTSYVRDLAEFVFSKRIILGDLASKSDQMIREDLITVKGIGNWTVDIFLIMALHRADIFPLGDLAAVKSLKKIKKLPVDTSNDKILSVSKSWRPFRSIATMLLWHSYIQENNIKF